jgi:3-methylcrotonyl-CoA carboxylase alpha subunit
MHLTIGEQAGAFAYQCTNQTDFDLLWGDQRLAASIYAHTDQLHVLTTRFTTQIAVYDDLAQASQATQIDGNLNAPMPGSVVSYLVKVGDPVTKGQPLAVIEAMKMEHTITSPSEAVVQELLFGPGDQVQEGAQLLTLGPSQSS